MILTPSPLSLSLLIFNFLDLALSSLLLTSCHSVLYLFHLLLSFRLPHCAPQNLKLNHCTGITVNGVKRLLDVPSLAQLFLLGCRNVRCAEFNKLQFPPSSFVCI